MHLRAPSVDQGVHAFGWSVVFFLFIWLGDDAVCGVSSDRLLETFERGFLWNPVGGDG